MRYCGKGEAALRRAMAAVVEGLEDEHTHIGLLRFQILPCDVTNIAGTAVYRPMLVRRLALLEKRLKIPPDECHSCEGMLLEPDQVYLEGVRVWKLSGPLGCSNRRDSETLVTARLWCKVHVAAIPPTPAEEALVKDKAKVETSVYTCHVIDRLAPSCGDNTEWIEGEIYMAR
jgi:hypothetical protein